MDLSYSSNHTLNSKIDGLPKGPEWTEWSMDVTGNQRDASGRPLTETVTMLRRDPVEVVAELLNNPALREG